jgi:hypothetical protein
LNPVSRIKSAEECSPALEKIQLRLKRIDVFEKGKPMEVRVPGTDPPDSMLAHENGTRRTAGASPEIRGPN